MRTGRDWKTTGISEYNQHAADLCNIAVEIVKQCQIGIGIQRQVQRLVPKRTLGLHVGLGASPMRAVDPN
jgi:hypothetical protein